MFIFALSTTLGKVKISSALACTMFFRLILDGLTENGNLKVDNGIIEPRGLNGHGRSDTAIEQRAAKLRQAITLKGDILYHPREDHSIMFLTKSSGEIKPHRLNLMGRWVRMSLK